MNARDWDRLAAAYESEVCDIFVRDRRKVIAGWLKARGLLRGGKTALDLGCGIGSFFKRHGRHFGEKTGTDHSRRMLRIAARRCRAVPDCHWQQADAQKLPPTREPAGCSSTAKPAGPQSSRAVRPGWSTVPARRRRPSSSPVHYA